MFRVTKGIHIHFAHVVHGHSGLCLGPHGHTWYFEVTLQAKTLDDEGFICDFGLLKRKVLTPIEIALDHAFAIGSEDYKPMIDPLNRMGEYLLTTRIRTHGIVEAGLMQEQNMEKPVHVVLPQMHVEFAGSVKLAVFDFTPTSERLARWLFVTAQDRMGDARISVSKARVYETLHPVQSFAEYSE